MLDLVHYYFETDNLGEKEYQDAKTKMRRVLYGQLYKRSYTWNDNSGGREFGTQETADSHHAGTPELTHKPYTPPTPVNANSSRPYGAVLDAPLG